MKTPHLLASLAVAATASAADLKDPAELTREWTDPAAQFPPLTEDLSLRKTTNPPRLAVGPMRLPALRDKSQPGAQVPPWSKPVPRPRATPPGPALDAPNYRIPDPLPDNMPPGTKSWEFGGQTYWLLPLIPSREK